VRTIAFSFPTFQSGFYRKREYYNFAKLILEVVDEVLLSVRSDVVISEDLAYQKEQLHLTEEAANRLPLSIASISDVSPY
jgi:hypothetical protein